MDLIVKLVFQEIENKPGILFSAVLPQEKRSQILEAINYYLQGLNWIQIKVDAQQMPTFYIKRSDS